jgi:hypothetical protein
MHASWDLRLSCLTPNPLFRFARGWTRHELAARRYGGRLRFGSVAWRNFLDKPQSDYGHDRFVTFVHGAKARQTTRLPCSRQRFRLAWVDVVEPFEARVLRATFTPHADLDRRNANSVPARRR